MRKHPNSHREAKATAPVLDSTRHYTQMHLAPREDERKRLIASTQERAITSQTQTVRQRQT